MIRLIDATLTEDDAGFLQKLQNKVLDNADFSDQVSKAQALWKSKGGAEGLAVFQRVRLQLSGMTPSPKTCHYCEGNENSDIEHVAPKAFFPQRTFEWNNYVLACKLCNTGYKLDKCFVLDEQGDCHEVARGSQPPFERIAFINPRHENPQDFCWLDLTTYHFQIHDDLSQSDRNKAAKTIEILALNERDYLVAGRKQVATEIYKILTLLRQILASETQAEMAQLLSPDEERILDPSLSLAEQKAQILQNHQRFIQQMPHPSVWQSIKMIDSKIHPKWIQLFDQLPMIQDW